MDIRDLVIVGAGPAGLTAGLYAARARLDTLLLERLSPGGQVLNTHWVENWPGDVAGVSGFDLADRFRDHALKFGLEIKSSEVRGLKLEGGLKVLDTDYGPVGAKALILATGASPRKLGVPGEAELAGRGVSYCGTCDGPFFRDKVVVAFGGGNTAAEEAAFLTKFAKKVYLVHRRDELRACKVLCERVRANPLIEVLWSHVPLAIEGTGGVESVLLKDLKSGQERRLIAEGAFVFVGTNPNTGFLKDSLPLDPEGFIVTDLNMQTSLPGVFAAGDCRASILRQIVVAAGDGAVASFAAQRYLEEHGI
ncbi:MAG: thioredoxin-disulfide reductase [Desulfarculus sp.]|nr:thioredoxin-disulfide reductase [Desulfarculus sp.]